MSARLLKDYSGEPTANGAEIGVASEDATEPSYAVMPSTPAVPFPIYHFQIRRRGDQSRAYACFRADAVAHLAWQRLLASG